MGIIVLADMKAKHAPSMESDFVRDGEIVAMHAAVSDPLTPEDPAEETLCGKPTAAMDKHSYQPSRPGATWYPQNLEQWVCRTCDQAIRSA